MNTKCKQWLDLDSNELKWEHAMKNKFINRKLRVYTTEEVFSNIGGLDRIEMFSYTLSLSRSTILATALNTIPSLAYQ